MSNLKTPEEKATEQAEEIDPFFEQEVFDSDLRTLTNLGLYLLPLPVRDDLPTQSRQGLENLMINSIKKGGFFTNLVYLPQSSFFREVREVITESMLQEGQDVPEFQVLADDLDPESFLLSVMEEAPPYSRVLIAQDVKYINDLTETLQKLDALNILPPRHRILDPLKPPVPVQAHYCRSHFSQSNIVEWMLLESRLNPCTNAARNYISRHRRTLTGAGIVNSYHLVLIPQLLTNCKSPEQVEQFTRALENTQQQLDLSQYVGMRHVFVSEGKEGDDTREHLTLLQDQGQVYFDDFQSLSPHPEEALSSFVKFPPGSVIFVFATQDAQFRLACKVLRRVVTPRAPQVELFTMFEDQSCVELLYFDPRLAMDPALTTKLRPQKAVGRVPSVYTKPKQALPAKIQVKSRPQSRGVIKQRRNSNKENTVTVDIPVAS